jgi:hypothetical protein
MDSSTKALERGDPRRFTFSIVSIMKLRAPAPELFSLSLLLRAAAARGIRLE